MLKNPKSIKMRHFIKFKCLFFFKYINEPFSNKKSVLFKMNMTNNIFVSVALPIHGGGRRLSHDPFMLCQDLQKIELARKSEKFQHRRKSEQSLPIYQSRRKSLCKISH